MPHHSFADAPHTPLGGRDAAVRHAHDARSRSLTRFPKPALDRHYRALGTDAE